MRKLLIVVLIPLGLGGCLSFSDNSPPPQTHTTIVAPPGSTVSCSNGQPGPC
jgi:hypothetical protein